MTKHVVDNLIYIDDYLDIIEALQLDLQKNLTLLKEMDGYAQESTSLAAKASIDLIDNIDNLNAVDKFVQLKKLITLLEETAQRNSEKAALAKITLEIVDRHCNRLDADLVKFEETQSIGPMRIASLPGLSPSSKSLRDYSKMSAKEKITKKNIDKRELQSSKKRRIANEDLQRALKEPRTMPVDKGGGAKPQKTLPLRKNGGKPKPSDGDTMADTSETLYCYCQQVSYGEMVACDNTNCDIEWFHIACVDLKTVPKGKWYCDNCSKYKGKQRKS